MVIEIGNMNYWFSDEDPVRNDNRLTWDVYSGRPLIRRNNNTVVYQEYGARATYNLTDLSWINSRFILANSQVSNFDYAVYLLQEEVFHPVRNADSTSQNMLTWTIEGKLTIAGETLKLLKTWVIENKGQTWNETWWISARDSNNRDDPLIKEWSEWYGYILLKSWHQHCHNLGKKSAIMGMSWLCLENTSTSCFETSMKKIMPGQMWQYIIGNYDLVSTYAYPRNSAELVNSVNQINTIRNLGYKGKIMHVLTSSFKATLLFQWTKALAWEEFKLVAPLVDAIITYQYAQDSWDWGDKQYYAATLIQFLEDYNNLLCPPPLCDFTITQL